jgi:hypothetical protein
MKMRTTIGSLVLRQSVRKHAEKHPAQPIRLNLPKKSLIIVNLPRLAN